MLPFPSVGYKTSTVKNTASGQLPPAPTLGDSGKGIDKLPALKAWDFKTATTGPKGEETPAGAYGWKPDGNPYYGEGVMARLKDYAYMFTKDIPKVENGTWDEIKARWQKANSTAVTSADIALHPELAGKQAQQSKDVLGLVGETIKTAWQAGSADGSVVSPVLRGVAVGVQAIGDIFNLPAIGIERGAGALHGFMDAADSVASPLPVLGDNWFTKLIEATPIGLAYDFSRLALSPSENKWEQAKTGIEDGWQSGRIFYSQVFDATIKEEFLRRYHAGENPEFLAYELQNPLAELGGQLLLDPTNILSVWTKGAKTVKDLDRAHDAVTATGLLADTDAIRALEVIKNSTDEAAVVGHWDTVVNAQVKAVETVEGSRLLNNTFTKNALTQGSRITLARNLASDTVGLMTSVLRKEGYDFHAVADAVHAGVLSVSKNKEEMQVGLSALSHLPSAHLFMNDQALTTFTVIRNLVTDREGLIDGTKLLRLADKKDMGEFAKAAGALIGEASKANFPDVQEMKKAAAIADKAAKTGAEALAALEPRTRQMADVYKNLSPAVKTLDQMNEWISKPKNWINSWLALDYFGARFGTAIKNITSNFEFILADKGASAWIKDVVKADGSTSKAYWSLGAAGEYLDDVFGFKASATGGFNSLVQSEAGAAEGVRAWLRNNLPGSKAMEAGEAAASTRIFAAAARDTMTKLLKPGLALPPLEVLQAAGLSDRQASQFAKFMMHYNGDGEKALSAFRGMYQTGAADEWRHLDFITKTYDGALTNLGMKDALIDFAQTGGRTTQEVEDFFLHLRKEITTRAGEAVKDMVGVSRDHPALDLIGHLDEQVKAGNLDAGSQEVFKAVMQASQNAKNEYMQALNDAVILSYGRLNQGGKMDEATKLKAAYDPIFKSFLDGGSQTKAVTEKALESTRAYYAEWQKLKSPTPSDLVALWKEANLAGEPPMDLSKQSLISELWRQHREKVSSDWNTYFDTLFKESEGMVKDVFGRYMDDTELKSQFSRAQYAVTQAQAYRQSVYEMGRLRINPKNDLNWLASKYGVASATESGKPGGRVLDTINKYVGTEAPDPVRVVRNFDKAVEAPIAHLPQPVADRFQQEAKRLLSEMAGGTGPGVSKGVQGTDSATSWFGSTNVGWYQDLPANMQNKPAIEKALQKIIDGKGDSGANVQRMKEAIISNFKYGDAVSGTPPDLRVLQEMDADKATMEKALQAFNEITHQDLKLNEAIRASGGTATAQKYTKLEDVPYDVAKAAFEKRRIAKGLPEVDLSGIAIPPPMTETLSIARSWSENAPGALHMLDDIKAKILENYGTKITGTFDPGIEKALKQYVMDSADKVTEAKAMALKIATEQRNFTLLNYGERTYADVAKSYVLPYHFFYSRHYGNLVKRIAQHPDIVAGYAKYKTFLENAHKDMPDWYKQQVNINPFAEGAALARPGAELLGIPLDHPLFINLEASVNPLYGLTGTDFNDAAKRTDWFSASVDDLGKFGPSLWAPLQMAMAVYQNSKGQAEAASAWGSRILPITNEIKTASSFLPFLKRPVEMDPATILFGGGYDAHERSRIGTALMQLTNEKIIELQNNPNLTPAERDQQIGELKAQADDAAFNQSGTLWDEAYKTATQNRGLNVAGGWMFGVGFKPRNETDVMQEKLFTDLNRLYAMSDSISPQQYRQEYDKLMEQYPAMEAVLLSRKGGDKRDSAYAYNVLNRLPPGKLNDVLTSIGLTQEDISKFYESKGFTNKDVTWTPTEKQRFMANVVDLAAMLNIPSDATREEWTSARNAYTQAQESAKSQFGADIWDVVNHYYDLKDDNPTEAAQFRQTHPEVSQALTFMQQAKVMNPLLEAYYGGVDTVEAYVNGQVRQKLTDKYGQEIYDLQTEYFNTKVGDPHAAKAFLYAHPELIKYWTEKRTLDEEANRQFIELANKIPTGESASVRPGYTAASGAQQEMLNAIQDPQALDWNQLSQNMSPQLQERIMNYWAYQQPLPKAATDELDYVATGMGLYNGDALLRRAGLALMQGGGQSETAPLPLVGF